MNAIEENSEMKLRRFFKKKDGFVYRLFYATKNRRNYEKKFIIWMNISKANNWYLYKLHQSRAKIFEKIEKN